MGEDKESIILKAAIVCFLTVLIGLMAGMIVGNLIKGRGFGLIVPGEKPNASYYEVNIDGNPLGSSDKIDIKGNVKLTSKGKDSNINKEKTVLKLEYWEKDNGSKKYTTSGTILSAFPIDFTETITDLKPLTDYEYKVLIGDVECSSVKSFRINPAAGLKLQMYNDNKDGEKGVSIRPIIKIVNDGTQAINLSDMKIRYYYTGEGKVDDGQTFNCDYAAGGNYDNSPSSIQGSFKKMDKATPNADYYLELTFSGKTLEKGAYLEMGLRFNKNDWSNYDQTNDYSYKGALSGFESWEKITAYSNGVLVFGTEP